MTGAAALTAAGALAGAPIGAGLLAVAAAGLAAVSGSRGAERGRCVDCEEEGHVGTCDFCGANVVAINGASRAKETPTGT